MNKPASLRAALTEALDPRHHIRRNPDRLLMTITGLRTLATGAPGHGFEYDYTLEIDLLDFAGDPTEVTVPLLLWVSRYQHQMLATADATTKGMNLTALMLDGGKVDIHIALKLTEHVRYVPREDGGHDVVYRDEPMPMALETGAPLHALFLNGELIARCTAHPDALAAALDL